MSAGTPRVLPCPDRFCRPGGVVSSRRTDVRTGCARRCAGQAASACTGRVAGTDLPSVAGTSTVEHMTPEAVAGYLDRIGADRPAQLDAEALRDLHVRHQRSVPFENLSIHLGEPVILDEAALVDKIVARRRGGFCYELNGAFAALLSALGFEVSLLGASTFADGLALAPLVHMAVRVDLPDGPWLADVGFGRGFAYHPLRLDDRSDQLDREGTFRLSETDSGDLLLTCDGAPKYRLETRPRLLTEFEPTCWWTQTSPRSRFTGSLVCSLVTGDGRLTLSGNELARTRDGVRHEETLADEAVLPAYRELFGITLEKAPRVRPQEPVLSR